MEAAVEAVLEALTPEEARDLMEDHERLGSWITKHIRGHWNIHRMLFLAKRAGEAPPRVVVPVRNPRRRDTDELLALVDRAVYLPPRLREVATLCLVHGLTLNECARRLGISRETVRVHLRRLRALRQLVLERSTADRNGVVSDVVDGDTERNEVPPQMEVRGA